MALPNKIFEYLAAGVPVLSANYPEARRIVEQNSVGLIFDPYDPVSIAGAIKQLMADSSLRQSFRENASIALANLDADAEWQKLVKIYDALPVTAGQGGGA
jgi:glycosyltransferase involved in cell wall biosynthesis